MKKSILILLSLILTLQASFADTNVKDFEGHWSEPYMSVLVSKNLFMGYDDASYKPDEIMSRAEFYTILGTYLMNQNVISPVAVDAAYWPTFYIEMIYQAGLTTFREPINAATFDVPVTRREMITLTMAALAKINSRAESMYGEAPDTSVPADVIENLMASITDLSSIPTGYQNDVLNAYGLGFVSGYGDFAFRPDGQATRGEASVVIAKLVDSSLRTPMVSSKIE